MRLTKDEILLMAIVLIALVAGAAAKQYRQAHPVSRPVVEPAKTRFGDSSRKRTP